MTIKWIGRLFAIALIILIFIAAGGQAVLHLWNWLLPPLFGWHAITFWEAVGILTLCRILFGNWGGRPLFRNRRRHWGERWEQMTPEEREKFRQGMRGRCGFGGGEPAAQPKA